MTWITASTFEPLNQLSRYKIRFQITPLMEQKKPIKEEVSYISILNIYFIGFLN